MIGKLFTKTASNSEVLSHKVRSLVDGRGQALGQAINRHLSTLDVQGMHRSQQLVRYLADYISARVTKDLQIEKQKMDEKLESQYLSKITKLQEQYDRALEQASTIHETDLSSPW